MNVVIRNLPDDTTREEVQEILKEHGVPVTDVTMNNEGDDKRLVAVIAMDTDHAGAAALVKMIDGKFWRGKTLRAGAMTMFTGTGLNE